MSVTSTSEPLTGLAKRLVDKGIINQNDLIEAQEHSKKQKISLISYLAKEKLADSKQVAIAASEEFGTPLLHIEAFDVTSLPREFINEKLVSKHQALPIYKRDNRLFIAMSDPMNLQALDEIKFNTGLTTEAVLADEIELKKFITSILENQETNVEIEDSDLEDLDIEVEGEIEEEVNIIKDLEEDSPVVRLVNKILIDAIQKNASDIHFEPYEKAYRVRFRLDGILQEITRPPVQISRQLAARLKVMSRMDISERRIPQDGRIKIRISKNKTIDFRVNTLPTLWGEKVCLRILDPSSAQLGIDALGYENEQKALYLDALSKPQGMILVTGPTGSGKTVSLYTGLNILNTEQRNISTAEDPVEINLEGINQVNVNNKVGLNFSAALRSFLRQDPDIVMVGEIRDLETAEIAVKAAQTGHLVLSTLHTNSAAETLTRLHNMGVPSFNIATSVSIIIAQRLARRLCKNCKRPIEIPKESLIESGFLEDEVDDLIIFEPRGCNKCNKGYKGRVGIYEVVKVTEKIARLIMENGNSIQIDSAAREEGFNNLYQSGLQKVREGVTSLEEINRVTDSH